MQCHVKSQIAYPAGAGTFAGKVQHRRHVNVDMVVLRQPRHVGAGKLFAEPGGEPLDAHDGRGEARWQAAAAAAAPSTAMAARYCCEPSRAQPLNVSNRGTQQPDGDQ